MYQVSKFVHPITRAVGSPHAQKLFTHRQRNTHLERPIFLSEISGQQSENLCNLCDFCNLSALRDDRCHWVTPFEEAVGSSAASITALSLFHYTFKHLSMWTSDCAHWCSCINHLHCNELLITHKHLDKHLSIVRFVAVGSSDASIIPNEVIVSHYSQRSNKHYMCMIINTTGCYSQQFDKHYTCVQSLIQ